MKEIKFRVWDGEKMNFLTKGNHLMLSFFSEGIPWGLYDSATEQRYVTGEPNAILNEPGHLMQYTGLKDKNGNDIYNGDIVRMKSYSFQHLDRYNYEVYYSEDKQRFMFRNNVKYPHNCDTDSTGFHSFEVIGNIHENPELLKQ